MDFSMDEKGEGKGSKAISGAVDKSSSQVHAYLKFGPFSNVDNKLQPLYLYSGLYILWDIEPTTLYP